MIPVRGAIGRPMMESVSGERATAVAA